MISFLANTGLRFNDNRPVDARDLVKVPYGEGAAAEMLKITNEVDTLFNKASSQQDEMRMSIWNRSGELVGKLSLLYAISESLDGTEPPVISVKAVRWAWRLVKSLQLRMIAYDTWIEALVQLKELFFVSENYKAVDLIAQAYPRTWGDLCTWIYMKEAQKATKKRKTVKKSEK